MAGEIVGLVTAFVLFGAGLISLHRKTNQIHVLVNARLEAALGRIDQLSTALVDAGILVPEEWGEEGDGDAG